MDKPTQADLDAMIEQAATRCGMACKHWPGETDETDVTVMVVVGPAAAESCAAYQYETNCVEAQHMPEQ